jgi:hypothetical protein
MIGPIRQRPEAKRVLGVERAAAVCGVSPSTLLTWAANGIGPTPYLHDDDGLAAGWTVNGLAAWRARRARVGGFSPAISSNPN